MEGRKKMKTIDELYAALPQPKPTFEVWLDQEREKVVATLTMHDALKAHEREAFAAFLRYAFGKR
jgi:hypothetical protein